MEEEEEEEQQQQQETTFEDILQSVLNSDRIGILSRCSRRGQAKRSNLSSSLSGSRLRPEGVTRPWLRPTKGLKDDEDEDVNRAAATTTTTTNFSPSSPPLLRQQSTSKLRRQHSISTPELRSKVMFCGSGVKPKAAREVDFAACQFEKENADPAILHLHSSSTPRLCPSSSSSSTSTSSSLSHLLASTSSSLSHLYAIPSSTSSSTSSSSSSSSMPRLCPPSFSVSHLHTVPSSSTFSSRLRQPLGDLSAPRHPPLPHKTERATTDLPPSSSPVLPRHPVFVRRWRTQRHLPHTHTTAPSPTTTAPTPTTTTPTTTAPTPTTTAPTPTTTAPTTTTMPSPPQEEEVGREVTTALAQSQTHRLMPQDTYSPQHSTDSHKKRACTATDAHRWQHTTDTLQPKGNTASQTNPGTETQTPQPQGRPGGGAAANRRPPPTPCDTPAATPVNPPPDVLTVNGKQYLKLQLLGRGGSSKVFAVLDKESKQVKAVKVVSLEHLDKDTLTSYTNEIGILERLRECGRVIRLYDHEVTGSQLVLVMEKGSLDFTAILKEARMKKDCLIPFFTIQHYWDGMLRAVQQIHQQGIIHSDLKPANFLLVDGTVKLIDFGIASSIQQDMTSIVKDSQAGTFNYMSPESLLDIHSGPIINNSAARKPTIKIGVKSDVWSLGCILYNLVYGRTPFQHISNPLQKLAAISSPNTKINFPDARNKHLVDVMRLCLQYDPRKRPSIEQLLDHPLLTS